MNKLFIRQLYLLTIAIVLIFSFSCTKLTEDPDISNALIAQWRYKQSAVDLTVGGVELVQYLTSNLGYNQDDAEAVSDSIISKISTNSGGTIVFSGEKSYQLTLDNQDQEEGTWSVSADGETLSLNNEIEIENLQIVTLTPQSLVLKLPADTEEVDFDSDGIDETSLDINVEQTLSKSSNGGAGG